MSLTEIGLEHEICNNMQRSDAQPWQFLHSLHVALRLIYHLLGRGYYIAAASSRDTRMTLFQLTDCHRVSLRWPKLLA